MDYLINLSKILSFLWVASVFIKAWGEGNKVWAIFSIFPLIAIIYCLTHWYEMKNYIYVFISTFLGFLLLLFILGYFGVI